MHLFSAFDLLARKRMKEIKKILVANRGEIAMRILRTAKEMDIATVAVFSEADRTSPHVRFADQAVCLGPPEASQSYLDQNKLIEISKELGVDAIHPGYGFLSENAGFARRVRSEGLIFIGPSSEAIETMGSKLAAKTAAAAYDIPMVPGTAEAITDRTVAKQVAATIGYPILIKASAGGGGKGMRIVDSEADFDHQMDRAVSEAEAAFGDGSVFIEKYITSPKHIEIQVLGDQHGKIVHLFDRECSIQRRHQKVMEEAPSVSIDDATRAAMGRCAIDVARSCGYYGAGTVEFILDEDKRFYFLEMNTRLQVEHPVTELITGIDLVKQMIYIAEGRRLPFEQSEIGIRGHAIECRVYAEDARNNFLPDVGQLRAYSPPLGNGVRVDDGVESGMTIPIYYDPLLAKLITYGQDRPEAIAKMTRAIEEFVILGVQTTLDFCRFVCQHPVFLDASFDTNFVQQHFTPDLLSGQSTQDQRVVAVLMTQQLKKSVDAEHLPANGGNENKVSKWKQQRRNP
ncbi:acetyl-CoA carboxylase biotin carboxylase subunit [Dyadobacter jejuensis]|uniref:Acetyl-CoA carboxylase biotin carboxylase subunit n=2 Tax=Dyadobacter jejuensis TaxID=1082580 RepID=A0A316AKI4_9BACT|nr:acetyl-CoA carboxylase biotin carboxylase subunit [Dyadobacter jejuensis]